MFGLLKYLYFCRRIKNNKNFTTMKKKSNLKKEKSTGIRKLTESYIESRSQKVRNIVGKMLPDFQIMH